MSKIKNAKEEYLNITKDYIITAAYISFNDYVDDTFKLKPLYTKDEYDNFLKFLDREYHSGYGGQELFGLIYCEDGVWIKREEYDGSEWWNVMKYPDLRETFDEVDVLKYYRREKLKNIENNL